MLNCCSTNRCGKAAVATASSLACKTLSSSLLAVSLFFHFHSWAAAVLTRLAALSLTHFTGGYEMVSSTAVFFSLSLAESSQRKGLLHFRSMEKCRKVCLERKRRRRRKKKKKEEEKIKVLAISNRYWQCRVHYFQWAIAASNWHRSAHIDTHWPVQSHFGEWKDVSLWKCYCTVNRLAEDCPIITALPGASSSPPPAPSLPPIAAPFVHWTLRRNRDQQQFSASPGNTIVQWIKRHLEQQQQQQHLLSAAKRVHEY